MDDVWKALTFLIACLVAWIGSQQWWVNREKLRLDLFERRHAIFETTRKFVSSVVREARIDPVEQQEFWANTIDARFLFHKEIPEYIDKVYSQSVQLHYRLKSMEARDDRHSEHVEAESQLILWFAEQLRDDGMPRVFAKYLSFQDLHGPLTVLWWRVSGYFRRARSS